MSAELSLIFTGVLLLSLYTHHRLLLRHLGVITLHRHGGLLLVLHVLWILLSGEHFYKVICYIFIIFILYL